MVTGRIKEKPLAMVCVPIKKVFQKATVTAFFPRSTTLPIPLIFGLGPAFRPFFFSAGVRTLRVVGTNRTMKYSI